MATHKHLFAMLVVASQLFAPVYAKISDLPAFSLWAAQWGPIGGQTRVERLPCLRATNRACGGALSSSLGATHHAQRAGSVDPFRHPARTVRKTRQHVVFKKRARMKTNSANMQFGAAASRQFSPRMLLSDGGRQVLDINLAQVEIPQPAEVATLAEYVTAVEPSEPPAASLVGEATGGLGDSAYVALYDFEDGTTPTGGETSGRFEEITTLLDANSTRAAITAVPEPKTYLLIGVGLLAWRARGRRRLTRASRRQIPGSIAD